MSDESSWLMSKQSSTEEIKSAFDAHGVVAVTGLLTSDEIRDLHRAHDEGIASGRLEESKGGIADNYDAIFRHPVFAKYVSDPRIIKILRPLLGHGIELQHVKYNAKPITGGGRIAWHQDFPFYPHTNHDLVSATVYLDDVNSENGAVDFVSGSHKIGEVSHVDADGKFLYGCHDQEKWDTEKAISLSVPAGTVTFHHCLTVHRSGPIKSSRSRRLLIFQYRAEDAVQLAGMVWETTGMDIARESEVRKARFPDGSTIVLRGVGGRLIDIFGSMKPDRALPSARNTEAK